MSGRRAVLLKPLLVWVALVALAALSLGCTLLPGLPAKLPIALAIVIVQASLVLAAFMNFGRASSLVRMSALIAVLWLSFLFLMAFADLLTR